MKKHESTLTNDNYFNYTKNNVDIFICSHNLFCPDNRNKMYKIVTDYVFNKTYIKNLTEQDVPEVTNMQRSYSECSRQYWVWKKYNNLKDYVGFCHYRRFFNFYDDIPDIEKLFKHYDAIVTKEKHFLSTTVEKSFSEYNELNFLKEWLDVLNRIHPKYTKKEIKKYLKSNLFCMRNMFILKKEDFYKYMEWCFSIAEEYNRINNLKTQEDVINFCKTKCNEWGVEYKDYYDRLHGYLFEICQGLYFKHNFKRILGLPIKMVE